MTLEISRRLIGGRWRTGSAAEGGGGGLPAGGSTGEVLTKASNADGDADWEPSGGSSSWQNLGLINVLDLLANGPTLVYTPGAGEYVLAAAISVVDFLDNGYRVVIGTVAEANSDPQDGLIGYDSDTVLTGLTPGVPPGAGAYTVPLYAMYLGNSSSQVITACGVWQAGHLYAVGDCIIDSDGYIERVTAGGTSGGTEPTWPDSIDADTVDGGVTWNNEDLAPTLGSARLFISTVTV